MFEGLFRKKVRLRNSRRFKRIRTSYLVKYEIRGKQEPRITNVRDIGAGGVCFWSSENLAPGAVLNLGVLIPPLNRAVQAVAQVLRARRTKGAVNYSVAVEFLDLKTRDREEIGKFAEALSHSDGTRFLIDHADIVVRTES